MSDEFHELFSLAAKFFFKEYKKKGGSQGDLAKQLGITQSYLSSVINGSRTASLDLQSYIAKSLFGPYDQFLEAGRRIKEGKDPHREKPPEIQDGVESLIAKLTYYVMDHKRIEEELKETKNFYEAIVENQQTGVLVMDRDHAVSYANEIMGKLSGIPTANLTNTTPYAAQETFNGLDIFSFTDMYDKAFKKLEPVSYKNIRTIMPDGNPIYISGWMIPKIKDGEFEGMICTLWDTTTSNILRNLFTSAFDFSPNGLGIIQQTKPGEMPSIYYMNKRFREIFDLHDVDPPSYPFKEVLNRMKDKMKNGDAWLEDSQANINNNNAGSNFIIDHVNSIQYECKAEPLIDDEGYSWYSGVSILFAAGKLIQSWKPRIKPFFCLGISE
jgi:PAS domain-containing protein